MFQNILQKSESYRRKVAMLTTGVLFLSIFFSWVSYKGIFSTNPQLADTLKNGDTVNTASVTLSDQPSAVQNSVKSQTRTSVSSDSAWDTLKKQFGLIKESVANVFAPFIGGIEVYDSTK